VEAVSVPARQVDLVLIAVEPELNGLIVLVTIEVVSQRLTMTFCATWAVLSGNYATLRHGQPDEPASESAGKTNPVLRNVELAGASDPGSHRATAERSNAESVDRRGRSIRSLRIADRVVYVVCHPRCCQSGTYRGRACVTMMRG
jgi:hypothetical protein